MKFWNPWRKADADTPVEPQETPLITLRASDNMMKRAENIWYGLGFVNDRFGSIPKIAGWLSLYRDWDAKTSTTPAPEIQSDIDELL